MGFYYFLAKTSGKYKGESKIKKVRSNFTSDFYFLIKYIFQYI